LKWSQWNRAWLTRIRIKRFLRKLPQNWNMIFRFVYVLWNSGVFEIKLDTRTGICFSDFLNGVFCSGRWSLSCPSNLLDDFFINWVRIELLLEHLFQFHLLSRFLWKKEKKNLIFPQPFIFLLLSKWDFKIEEWSVLLFCIFVTLYLEMMVSGLSYPTPLYLRSLSAFVFILA